MRSVKHLLGEETFWEKGWTRNECILTCKPAGLSVQNETLSQCALSETVLHICDEGLGDRAWWDGLPTDAEVMAGH